MNNKIDLEIRILDGILKLLNAICSTPVTTTLANLNAVQLSSSYQATPAASNSSASSSSQTASSILINNFDLDKHNDTIKCSALGAAIAAAVMSKNSSELSSASTQQQNTGNQTSISAAQSFDSASSTEYNHVFQILTACKCLFVSHRKIAIYLQNLQEIEAKSKKDLLEENDENKVDIYQLKHLNKNGISIDTCKLMLSDIRIPLSWKWNEYLRASKNSGIFFVYLIELKHFFFHLDIFRKCKCKIRHIRFNLFGQHDLRYAIDFKYRCFHDRYKL